MDLPLWMQEDELKQLLQSLYIESELLGDARIRLTIFRDGEGRFTPETNNATCIASIEYIEGDGFELNEKGIAIGLFQDLAKPPSRISNFKRSILKGA